MELVHCKELLQVNLILDWISLKPWVHFGLDRKEEAEDLSMDLISYT